MLQALIFDVDGTLADSFDAIATIPATSETLAGTIIVVSSAARASATASA